MDSTLLPDNGLIRLVSWPDALADAAGHPVRSRYTERFWLGILGPTATWLLLHCSDAMQDHREGTEIDLSPLAQSLGLAFRPGRPNPFSRGFERLVMFGLMRHVSNTPVPTFAMRASVPPLSARQLARLPLALQEEHARLVRAPAGLVSVRA